MPQVLIPPGFHVAPSPKLIAPERFANQSVGAAKSGVGVRVRAQGPSRRLSPRVACRGGQDRRDLLGPPACPLKELRFRIRPANDAGSDSGGRRGPCRLCTSSSSMKRFYFYFCLVFLRRSAWEAHVVVLKRANPRPVRRFSAVTRSGIAADLRWVCSGAHALPLSQAMSENVENDDGVARALTLDEPGRRVCARRACARSRTSTKSASAVLRWSMV